MTATKLGVVQMRIMQVLWDNQRATAREITDELNRLFPTEPIAHSTVQTLLRGLMEKGSVAHKTEGRTFVFEPIVAEDNVRQSATRELLTRAFAGSASDLVSWLLKNESVSRSELDRIKRLINEKSKNKKG